MHLEVIMIDDHPPIIEGYKAIITNSFSEYSINVTAIYDSKSAYDTISSSKKDIDIIVLDLSLPPYPEKKISSGKDLIPLIRKHFLNCKIIVLTSHTELIILKEVITENNPEGLLLKTETRSDEFVKAFENVIKGDSCYSKTVKRYQKMWEENKKLLDNYNLQILNYLSKGIKTKNLHEYIPLSTSAIEKRKVIIKELLGIQKANDEDLLAESRNRGFI